MYAVGLERDTRGPVLREVRKPEMETEDQVLVKMLRAGICGTDRNMIRYEEKDLPPGEDFITLGHEGLGRVEAVGPRVRALRPGDLVVPTVRRGCGECSSCLNDQSDMCFTGRYKERGIHKLHGFFTEYIVDQERYLVKVPPGVDSLAVLAEPLSIAEKALEQLRSLQLRLPWMCPHVEHRYGAEMWGHCKRALVIGAGPIGLLGTALLRLAGVETFVLEVVPEDSIRVRLVRELGAHHIEGRDKTPEDIQRLVGSPDFIFEASGASELALTLIPILPRNGAYILTGIPRGDSQVCMDGDLILRQLVRYNQLVIGSVNSNREHFAAALQDLLALRQAFPGVLEGAITHLYPLTEYPEALSRKGLDQLKVVFEVSRPAVAA